MLNGRFLPQLISPFLLMAAQDLFAMLDRHEALGCDWRRSRDTEGARGYVIAV